MLRHTKWSIGTLPGVLLAAAIAIGLAQPDQAWGQASVSVEADGTRHAGQFVVPVNKSQVLRLDVPRSEEHTSELQSLMRTSYAVFCLKKKKKHHKHLTHTLQRQLHTTT